MEICALCGECVTLYPRMSPFWVSRGGVSQLTSRAVGDAAATLMDWGATEGAAQEEKALVRKKGFRCACVCVCVCVSRCTAWCSSWKQERCSDVSN